VTSPTLGTGRKRLWLLRSRPDQVDRATMRGGPSRRIISEKDRRAHHQAGRNHDSRASDRPARLYPLYECPAKSRFGKSSRRDLSVPGNR